MFLGQNIIIFSGVFYEASCMKILYSSQQSTITGLELVTSRFYVYLCMCVYVIHSSLYIHELLFDCSLVVVPFSTLNNLFSHL